LLTIISTSCSAIKQTQGYTKSDLEIVNDKPKTEIKTGADNYNNYLPLLNNKQIGIVTNQTGILSNKTHLVDFF
jgi:uncharacterized protein YbbC (DUF1343 family)